MSPDGIHFDNLRDGSADTKALLSLATIYVASEYVYAAMRWRAMKYAEAPLIVQRDLAPPDEGAEWIADHELQELFDNPAPDYDMAELLRLTRMYRDLWGSALWVKERNAAGGIARLVPYAADEFSVVPDPTGLVLYKAFRLSYAGRPIPREEAVFWREPNPYDWDSGIGPAEVIQGTGSLENRASLTIADILKQ